ncbi:MAG: hypothetical protein K2X49_16985, partial [Acetobacteraceae bacterium]|nr:hypothetical protein [Acetobacteraceae bacterium]
APHAPHAPPAPQTRSVPHTVAELAEICAIPPASREFTAANFFCRGFLAGVGQYHGALHPLDGPRPPLFCVPSPPPTLLAAANAFVAWTRANPQHGDEAAVDGLVRFAVAAWPCPPGTGRPAARRGGG